MTYLISGSIGEFAACTVRVPMEVVKQRAQAVVGLSSYSALKEILSAKRESVFAGLYRGFGITAMRDVPYTMIQFALYEELKRVQARRLGKEKVSPGEAAVCGSIAGGIAGGVTTPLDVLKTRIMLAKEVTEEYTGADGIEHFSNANVETNCERRRGECTTQWARAKSSLDKCFWSSLLGFIRAGKGNFSGTENKFLVETSWRIIWIPPYRRDFRRYIHYAIMHSKLSFRADGTCESHSIIQAYPVQQIPNLNIPDLNQHNSVGR